MGDLSAHLTTNDNYGYIDPMDFTCPVLGSTQTFKYYHDFLNENHDYLPIVYEHNSNYYLLCSLMYFKTNTTAKRVLPIFSTPFTISTNGNQQTSLKCPDNTWLVSATASTKSHL